MYFQDPQDIINDYKNALAVDLLTYIKKLATAIITIDKDKNKTPETKRFLHLKTQQFNILFEELQAPERLQLAKELLPIYSPSSGIYKIDNLINKLLYIEEGSASYNTYPYGLIPLTVYLYREENSELLQHVQKKFKQKLSEEYCVTFTVKGKDASGKEHSDVVTLTKNILDHTLQRVRKGYHKLSLNIESFNELLAPLTLDDLKDYPISQWMKREFKILSGHSTYKLTLAELERIEFFLVYTQQNQQSSCGVAAMKICIRQIVGNNFSATENNNENNTENKELYKSHYLKYRDRYKEVFNEAQRIAVDKAMRIHLKEAIIGLIKEDLTKVIKLNSTIESSLKEDKLNVRQKIYDELLARALEHKENYRLLCNELSYHAPSANDFSISLGDFIKLKCAGKNISIDTLFGISNPSSVNSNHIGQEFIENLILRLSNPAPSLNIKDTDNQFKPLHKI